MTDAFRFGDEGHPNRSSSENMTMPRELGYRISFLGFSKLWSGWELFFWEGEKG